MNQQDIYSLSGRDLDYLIHAAQKAQQNGQALSITIDGGVKVKRGESIWTPAFGRPIIQLKGAMR